MQDIIIFILVYMIIQNILLIIEYSPYVDMLENIQKGEVFDGTSTLPILLKSLLLYIIVYGSMLYLFIRYLYKNASYTESFIFGSIVVLVLDFTLLAYFKKANNHIPVLLFDTFVLGGVNVIVPLYLIRTNYKLLVTLMPLLFIGFIISTYCIIYKSYTDTQQKLKLQKEKHRTSLDK